MKNLEEELSDLETVEQVDAVLVSLIGKLRPATLAKLHDKHVRRIRSATGTRRPDDLNRFD